jgi:hypothetical protein
VRDQVSHHKVPLDYCVILHNDRSHSPSSLRRDICSLFYVCVSSVCCSWHCCGSDA